MPVKKLDPEKLRVIHQGKHQDVEYKMYWDNRGDLLPPENASRGSNTTSHVCFADVKRKVFSGDYNRIIFYLNISCCDADIRRFWITEGAKAGTIPPYITYENSNNGMDFIIKLDEENVPLSLLYVWLTTLRALQETKDMVVATKLLMKEYSMSYFPALVLAGRMHGIDEPHTYLSVRKDYGWNIEDVNNLQINAGYVVGLKRYIEDPVKYDNRVIYKDGAFTKRGSDERYNGVGRIESACEAIAPRFVRPHQLLNKTLLSAMCAKSNTATNRLLKKMKAVV